MQIAQVLAGYTLGGADLLRRAMGKKKPEEMAKQRAIFIKGATERGVEEATATHIFDLMEKFAGYGFNKSHSAAYALLSYQTAWLKTHHPAAFMAAALSSEVDKTDKLVPLIEEVKRLGLQLQKPDINHSEYLFTVSGEGSIRYGLGAIKGVGEPAVVSLLAERKAKGPFKSLEDLCRRADLSKINKRVLEQLVRSGALDSIGSNRASLADMLPEAVKFAEQSNRASDVGQQDLFGGSAAVALPSASLRMKTLQEWTPRARLEAEHDALGLYLTGHPFDEFRSELTSVVAGNLVDLMGPKPEDSGEAARFGKPATVAGMVLDIFKRNERVIFQIDDNTAKIEASIFEEQFEPFKEILQKGAIVVLDGNLRFDDFINGWRFNAKKITDINQLREAHATSVGIRTSSDMTPELADNLKKILEPHVGGYCEVHVNCQTAQASADLKLPEKWAVKLNVDLTEKLLGLVGAGNVSVLINRPKPNLGFQRKQYPPRDVQGGGGHSQRPQGRLERAMSQAEEQSPTPARPAPQSQVVHKVQAPEKPAPAPEPDAQFAPAI